MRKLIAGNANTNKLNATKMQDVTFSLLINLMFSLSIQPAPALLFNPYKNCSPLRVEIRLSSQFHPALS